MAKTISHRWSPALFATIPFSAAAAIGHFTNTSDSAARKHDRTTINATFSVDTEKSHRIGDSAARRLPSVAVQTSPRTASRAADSFDPLIVANTYNVGKQRANENATMPVKRYAEIIGNALVARDIPTSSHVSLVSDITLTPRQTLILEF